MITAETISCTSTSNQPNFVELTPNWMTTLNCDIPEIAGQWGNFWESPSLVIGALASIGTLIAVFVAVKQSSDAKEIAENGESNAIGIARRAEQEAMKLALLNRELDNFEVLADNLINYSLGVSGQRKQHLKDSTLMTLSASKLMTYLRQREAKLADAVRATLDILQRVGMEINTAKRAPGLITPGHAKTAYARSQWMAANPNADENFVLTTSAISKVITDFYSNAANSSDTIERLTETNNLMKEQFAILLQHSYAESADLDKLIAEGTNLDN